MNDSFALRLEASIRRTGNPSLLGLDTQQSHLPPYLLREEELKGGNKTEILCRAIARFNLGILEALAGFVPAVKFQSAYYEQFGPEGIACLASGLASAKKLGFLTILDAKRNDIGSTAEAYARAILGESDVLDEKIAFLNADAVTVNAYLGTDGVEPFLKYVREAGKGCFILVRTSNPSAGDLQDLSLADGRKVYEAMADLVACWGDSADEGEFSSVGAVVGATWPEQAKELRTRMPRQFFLIPGYGAQGGKADGAVAGFTADGRGGIVNASRSLMLAWKNEENTEDFAMASRREAERMKQDLGEALIRAKH